MSNVKLADPAQTQRPSLPKRAATSARVSNKANPPVTKQRNPSSAAPSTVHTATGTAMNSWTAEHFNTRNTKKLKLATKTKHPRARCLPKRRPRKHTHFLWHHHRSHLCWGIHPKGFPPTYPGPNCLPLWWATGNGVAHSSGVPQIHRRTLQASFC